MPQPSTKEPETTGASTRPAADGRDVILVLYSRSWAAAVASGVSFSEARLAAALPTDPRVRRLLLVNPHRSIAARAWRSVRPLYPEPARPAHVHLLEPSRIRLRDPVNSRPTIGRYEASIR